MAINVFFTSLLAQFSTLHSEHNRANLSMESPQRIFWLLGRHANLERSQEFSNIKSVLGEFIAYFANYIGQMPSEAQSLCLDLQLILPAAHLEGIRQFLAEQQHLYFAGADYFQFTLHVFNRQHFYLEDTLFLHELAKNCSIGIVGPYLGMSYDIHKTLLSALSGLLNTRLVIAEDCVFLSLLNLRHSLQVAAVLQDNIGLTNDAKAEKLTSPVVLGQPHIVGDRSSNWLFILSQACMRKIFHQEVTLDFVDEFARQRGIALNVAVEG